MNTQGDEIKTIGWGTGSTPEFRYWRQFDSLTIGEIAALMCNIDPRALTDAVGPDGDPWDTSDEVRMLTAAVETGRLTAVPQPARIGLDTRIDRYSLIQWLDARGETGLVKGLELAVASIKSANGHQGESVIEDNVRMHRDWREVAREIADEFFNQDTMLGVRDSLLRAGGKGGYAVRVMDAMRERKIHGPRGPINNPSTIVRDALGGKLWWAIKPK